jgi:transcriptional regulator with XRE-family HTH domain
LPRCHRQLKCLKPRRKGYPEEPRTLGEHLKRHRLDLGLRQRDVGAEIGVKAETVGHWELGRSRPPVRLIPAIHRFLGFCPLDPTWTRGDRLRAAREAQGLSRRRVAGLVGVDEGTVWRAESRDGRVTRLALRAVRRILGGVDP